MLTKEARDELVKQQYRIVGEHSAVKVCEWTKKMIKGEGGCYKLTFYGIMSNQCMQMSPSLSCANRCTFCWRGYKAPVSKTWKWSVDEPSMISEESQKAHHKLLVGIKGAQNVNIGAYEKSKQVKHVALSLTGEPITYPKINELIETFHKQGISTFLVTNAQYPEQIRDLKLVTQLYISCDAPTKELLKKIDVPLFSDFWERHVQSLKYMAQKPYRKCIRLTHIKGINDVHPEKYAELIRLGNPEFIEVKGYTYAGASRTRHTLQNAPFHEDVVEFSKQIQKELPEYELATEHVQSRAVLLAKKELKKNGKWHTWIDFRKFNELALSSKEFTTADYLLPTPKVGLTQIKTKIQDSPNVRFTL